MTLRNKILFWILGAACLSVIALGNNPYRYIKLSESGVQTTAKIVSLTPADHNTYRFRFRVTGTYYEGIGFIDNLKTTELGNSLTILLIPKPPIFVLTVNHVHRPLIASSVSYPEQRLP